MLIVLIMVNTEKDSHQVLSILGQRLKDARLSRNESQEVFAARIGLSRQSYAKMEKGEGSIPIINWILASDIIGRLDSWDGVLAEKQNLFEQYEQRQKKRKRASGKRARPEKVEKK